MESFSNHGSTCLIRLDFGDEPRGILGLCRISPHERGSSHGATEEGKALALYVKRHYFCFVTDLGYYFLVEPKKSKHPKTIQAMVEYDYEMGINSFANSSSEEEDEEMPTVNI